MFRLATFNVNSVRARMPLLLEWLAANTPDAICLQETKVTDPDFPAATIAAAGYDSAYFGQKSYNGVAILSRHGFDNISKGLRDGIEETEQARLIEATIRGITIVNTYIPQGEAPGTPKFDFKMQWYKRVETYFDTYHANTGLLAWCGDFNVAPDAIDVYAPDKLDGQCGFHPEERAAAAHLISRGFTDVFRTHNPGPGHYTFWDYRSRGGLARNSGWRIDHIWATSALAALSKNSWVDIDSRRAEKSSDHAVLVAEFDI